MKTITVSVISEISLDDIASLLCSAFEGGSNYWYYIEEEKEPKSFEFRCDEKRIYNHIDYPLNEEGYLIIRSTEDSERHFHKFDLDAIKRGLNIMANKYPNYFADIINGNGDAETGDVFLQCCLFGEAIYG